MPRKGDLDPTGTERVIAAATADLFDSIGRKEVSFLIERAHAQIGNYCDPSKPDSPTLAMIARVEMAAAGKQGAPHVTRMLCKLNGGVFVPHIDLSADEGTVPFLAMQLAKELGDVTGEIALAMADGAISAREAEGVLAQLDELDTKSAQLRAAMKRIGEAEAK